MTSSSGRNLDTLDFIDPSYAPEQQGKTKGPSPGQRLRRRPRHARLVVDAQQDAVPLDRFREHGSSRGNFVPVPANPNDGHWSKHREGDFQDIDQWLNTVEAPKFVGPRDRHAARRAGRHPVPLQRSLGRSRRTRTFRGPAATGRAPGCHGAYSPRYIHQAGLFAGSEPGRHGPVTPCRSTSLGTDSAQSSFYAGVWFPARPGRKAAFEQATNSGCRIPTRRTGYVIPETRELGQPPTTTPARSGPQVRPRHARRVHRPAAPRRVGVRAVLPQRQRAHRVGRAQALGSPHRVAAPTDPGERSSRWAIAATTRARRAYDYDKLGWKYEASKCDPSASAAYNMTLHGRATTWTCPGAERRRRPHHLQHERLQQGQPGPRVHEGAHRRRAPGIDRVPEDAVRGAPTGSKRRRGSACRSRRRRRSSGNRRREAAEPRAGCRTSRRTRVRPAYRRSMWSTWGHTLRKGGSGTRRNPQTPRSPPSCTSRSRTPARRRRRRLTRRPTTERRRSTHRSRRSPVRPGARVVRRGTRVDVGFHGSIGGRPAVAPAAAAAGEKHRAQGREDRDAFRLGRF